VTAFWILRRPKLKFYCSVLTLAVIATGVCFNTVDLLRNDAGE
jgi:hypothetical protein